MTAYTTNENTTRQSKLLPSRAPARERSRAISAGSAASWPQLTTKKPNPLRVLARYKKPNADAPKNRAEVALTSTAIGTVSACEAVK